MDFFFLFSYSFIGDEKSSPANPIDYVMLAKVPRGRPSKKIRRQFKS